MSNERLDCVMLAAGASARMDGKWKMLLPFEESSVIECSVGSALRAGCRVLLVVGHRAAELARLFGDHPDVELVENPEYTAGMFSSIRAAVGRVRSARFYVALGDMPMIQPEVYRLLAATGGYDVVRPTWHGRKGHPVLLDRSVIDSIQNSDNSHSMSDILRDRRLMEIPVPYGTVTWDIDTAHDYERLRSHARDM